jgi:Protein of unknown function (DUF2817)
MTNGSFSEDFPDARDLFITSAKDAGASLESHDYPAPGPKGETLVTDVAWIGPSDAPKVFVAVSGTHGIEGFCGSAAQVDWLTRGEWKRLPKDTAAMFIHAINPYGFAWLRRVTHENIDLNRNWADFSNAPDRNAAYDEIAEALCPSDWSDESQARTLAILQAYIAQHGFDRFKAVVSSGQHRHADGLFFGGQAPCFARRTLEKILIARLDEAKRVGVIDYHTGLGPLGYGELMTSEPRGSKVFERTCRWYGSTVTPIGVEDSASAMVNGDWISAVPALLPHAEVTAIALEFGTVSPLEVLQALRADNWLHKWGDATKDWPQAIKQEMLSAFLGSSALWRGMVLGQSLAATRQAIQGLQQ